MAPRRRGPTAESKARAERIAAALAGLLDGAHPTEAEAHAVGDPYRPVPRAPRTRPPTVTGLACARCEVPMDTVYSRGVTIDKCAQCGGLWLDPGELDELVIQEQPPDPPPNIAQLRAQMRLTKGATSLSEPVVYRKCPRCSDPMSRRNFGELSGVVIDECPAHGVFLDPDELEAIETFVHLGGLALRDKDKELRLRERAHEAAERRHEAELARERAERRVWWSFFSWFT